MVLGVQRARDQQRAYQGLIPEQRTLFNEYLTGVSAAVAPPIPASPGPAWGCGGPPDLLSGAQQLAQDCTGPDTGCASYGEPTTGVGGLDSLSSSSNRCHQLLFYVSERNFFGVTLWHYNMDVYACWNGSKVTYLLHSAYPSDVFFYWTFDGNIVDKQAFGPNAAFATAIDVGKFRYCPPVVGCIQTVYPRIVFTQHFNGLYNAEGS